MMEQETSTVEQPQLQQHEQTVPIDNSFPLSQFGVSPELANALIQYALQQPEFQSRFEYVDQTRTQTAIAPLKEEWGDAFDTNFSLVQERFKMLTPQQQAIYDNVDGARFLYQMIQQEQQQHQTQSVPTFDRGSSTSPSNGKFRYRLSEVNAMPKSDYVKNVLDIQQAFASGQVDLNS